MPSTQKTAKPSRLHQTGNTADPSYYGVLAACISELLSEWACATGCPSAWCYPSTCIQCPGEIEEHVWGVTNCVCYTLLFPHALFIEWLFPVFDWVPALSTLCKVDIMVKTTIPGSVASPMRPSEVNGVHVFHCAHPALQPVLSRGDSRLYFSAFQETRIVVHSFFTIGTMAGGCGRGKDVAGVATLVCVLWLRTTLYQFWPTDSNPDKFAWFLGFLPTSCYGLCKYMYADSGGFMPAVEVIREI